MESSNWIMIDTKYLSLSLSLSLSFSLSLSLICFTILCQCIFLWRRGSCKKANLGLPCEIGLRTRTFHILSGSVLSVWSKVESVLAAMPGGNTSKMQIIRLKTDCGQRIVGKSLHRTTCTCTSFWLLNELFDFLTDL